MKAFNDVSTLMKHSPELGVYFSNLITSEYIGETFDYVFGGACYVVESPQEINDMVSDYGKQPDVVSILAGNVVVCYIVNNGGGPSFAIPLMMYDHWICSQDSTTKKDFLDVTFAELSNRRYSRRGSTHNGDRPTPRYSVGALSRSRS